MDSGLGLRPRDPPHLKAERDVAEDGEVGEQGVGLKDEIHRPEIGGHLPHGASLDQDFSLIRTLEPGQQP